jgi:hypothetical protein
MRIDMEKAGEEKKRINLGYSTGTDIITILEGKVIMLHGSLRRRHLSNSIVRLMRLSLYLDLKFS